MYFGLFDPLGQIGDDLDQSGALPRVDPQHRAADAAVLAVVKAVEVDEQELSLNLGSHEEVDSSSGNRHRGRLSADGDRDGRDTGSQLGAMRERLVVEPAGQRVRATTSGMRERLVVGSGRRRLQATTGNDTYASAM